MPEEKKSETTNSKDYQVKPEEIAENIKNICESFKAAEICTKKAEKFNIELGIPSINELRYAGKHLCSYLTASNDDEKVIQLDKARNHCLRAQYDAQSAIQLFFFESIIIFDRKYGHLPETRQQLPDYDEIVKLKYQRFTLDDDIDVEDIDLSDDLDLLSIHLEKIEKAKPSIEESLRRYKVKEDREVLTSKLLECRFILAIIVAISGWFTYFISE
jgi:hypothetical protein